MSGLHRSRALALCAVLALLAAPVAARRHHYRGHPAWFASAPASCTPSLNAAFAKLLAQGTRAAVDGIEVCGTTISSSRTQPGGPHGDHQILPLRVPLPDGSVVLAEVVTNDALDGKVTAPSGATVVALGQFFKPSSHFVGGIHDTHCATHRGAADGFVSVNGTRYPAAGCSR